MVNKKQTIIVGVIILNLFYAGIGFAQPRLEVTGIIDDEEPIAIVNGQVVKEGDKIGQVEIVKIRPDAVEFKYMDNVFSKAIGKGVKEKAMVKKQATKNTVISKIKAFIDDYKRAKERKIKSSVTK